MKIGHLYGSTCKNGCGCWLQRHGIQCESFSLQHMYRKISVVEHGLVDFCSVEFDQFYTGQVGECPGTGGCIKMSVTDYIDI